MKQSLVRILVITIMIYAVWSLQQAFDRGDIKKASRSLYEYKIPPQNESLITLMARQFGVAEDQVDCELELISRYVGPIRAVCKGGVSTQEFHFDIDVLRFVPEPTDAATRALFEESKP